MRIYFVYHNRRRDRVRIHEAGCRYCNAGEGAHPGSSGRDDEWLGPFARDAAFLAARRLCCDDYAPCGCCRP